MTGRASVLEKHFLASSSLEGSQKLGLTWSISRKNRPVKQQSKVVIGDVDITDNTRFRTSTTPISQENHTTVILTITLANLDQFL